MTTTFRTQVLYLPPTPLGLLPGRWAVEHRCTICRVRVATDDLTSHAQEHVAVQSTTGFLDRQHGMVHHRQVGAGGLGSGPMPLAKRWSHRPGGRQ